MADVCVCVGKSTKVGKMRTPAPVLKCTNSLPADWLIDAITLADLDLISSSQKMSVKLMWKGRGAISWPIMKIHSYPTMYWEFYLRGERSWPRYRNNSFILVAEIFRL